MSGTADQFDVKGLDNILKALKAKPSVVRVGILGSNDARPGKVNSNAEIGAVHEYGSISRHIPQRSFLRVPISENLNKKLEKSNAFDKNVLKDVIVTGSIKPWLKKIGIVAEACIQEAFDTGGGGKWPAHSPNYHNKTGQLLIDDGYLRESISSEVV